MAGLLFVISGPSGVGKGSIIQGLLICIKDLLVSVSATTRHSRPGEINGIHYHFLRQEEFLRHIESGKFLEWVQVHGAYYGTPKQFIEKELSAGKDIVLDIEVKGAKEVRKYFTDAVSIFIIPPSLEELHNRLLNRKTENKDARSKRLARAEEELREIQEYDYIVINEDLEKAIQDVCAIITAERCRNRQKKL